MSESFDIAVVGGGAAGIAAAVSSARAGCKTLLLDRRPAAGGTGGFSGLTTMCGLFDSEGEWLNNGFTREFAEQLAAGPPRQMGRVWALPYRPERFRALAANMLASAPNLETRWNTPLAGVTAQQGRVTSLNGLEIGAVIDCSGTAEVARSINAPCMETDETTQAPAVVFQLSGVQREWDSPAAAARDLLPLARAGMPPLNFQPGPDPGTVTVKFTGPPEQAPEVIESLRAKVHGFEKCQAARAEFQEAHRAGRMIIGQYILTGADVLAGRKFPDAAARCAWPVEQWSADGRARFRYLPKGVHYEIPARSLCAVHARNLFMAGKTISADADGIASARVMGCCLATGAAAGQLAAERLTLSGTR
ncbi:MAG TPA: FAD-dependent oxidoreductase [Verrucomicrobiae bacterium]|jgi:hypothetical protein